MLSKISSFFSTSPQQRGRKGRKDVKSGVLQSTNENEKMEARKPRTLNQMLRYRAQSTPNSPLLTYPTEGTKYVSHTASEVDNYVQEAAHTYASSFPQRTSSREKPKVIALLGLADLDYVVTMFAMYRLGHTVVALSPRLSQTAYEHLINKLDVHGLIYHPTKSKMVQNLKESILHIQICELTSENKYKNGKSKTVSVKKEPDLDMDIEGRNIAVVIHSSGSTGLPKPTKLSHDTLLMAASKNMDMKAFSCVPFFHGFGLNGLHRGIYAGQEFFFYNASLPLTSKHLETSIMDHNFEIFFCVPYALKLLAETDSGLKALERCRLVWFAGSACPDELGDTLTKKGIKVISDYGLSECGPLMTTMRPDDDHAWNYLRPLPHNKPYMTFEERNEGEYELVCHDGMPWKVASNRDDGSYATGDIFEKHPAIEDAYRFVSRTDDTLVLYNGEKADPSVLEGKVRQQALVADAVMFGTGKSELGLALIASDAAKDMEEDNLRESLWPAIQEAQTEMPEYAKIVRSMVVILPAGTEYPRTDKGTIIRQQFYQKFSQEIENAYAEELSEGLLDLNRDDLQSFIRNELIANIEEGAAEVLDLDTDLFNLGIDSLQSTQLRRALQSRIDLKGQKLPFNVVYENPTIRQLSDFITHMVSGDVSEPSNVKETFHELVEQHSHFTPEGIDHEDGHVVLTGATGSLGAHLLSQLVKNDKVKMVYCLVRADNSESASERVSGSLKSRHVHDELDDDMWSKVTPLAANLAASNLGLDAGTYRQIALKVSTVIHAAWPVNFNMSLNSFKSDIAGTKNLLDLCLTPHRTSSASFAFCSSISTLMHQDIEQPVSESVSADPELALDMGYAQSKLVAENLCVRAAEQTGIKAYVMRIGQISADTKHGVWNPFEAVPMMIQTAETTGSLPDMDEIHKWLPVDVVAATILDIALAAEASPGSVFNIVNPTGFKWRSDLLPKLHQAGLEFDEVPVSQWLEKLHSSEEDGDDSSPLKLLSYFDDAYGRRDSHGRGENRDFEADNTTKYSSTFGKGWALSQDTVQKLVEYLKDSWHESPAENKRQGRSGSMNDRRLEGDQVSQRSDDTRVNGVHPDNSCVDQGRTTRNDSLATLNNEDRRSSDGKITWDNEAKKFDVPDIDVVQPDMSQVTQSHKGSNESEIDIEAIKAKKVVGWSGTQFEVHGQA